MSEEPESADVKAAEAKAEPPKSEEPKADAAKTAAAAEPTPAPAPASAKKAEPLAPPVPPLAPALIFRHDGTRFAKFSGSLEPYDFRRPVSISKLSMRSLETSHARLAANLSERLALFFRMDCTVKVSKLGNVPFAKFKDGLENLAHLAMFQVEGLRGIGVLNLGLPLAMAVVDRLLGGKGQGPSGTANRVLTEIETALVEDLVLLIAREWADLWRTGAEEMKVTSLGVETSGAFLQTSAPDAGTLVVDCEMTLGEMNGSFQLGLPFSMIENQLKRADKMQRRDEGETSKKMEWYEPYDGITVPITAEWRVREISVSDVLKFKVGDVLEMPKNLIDKTYVRLADRPEFIGTVGIENGRVAVQLAQQLLLEP